MDGRRQMGKRRLTLKGVTPKPRPQTLEKRPTTVDKRDPGHRAQGLEKGGVHSGKRRTRPRANRARRSVISASARAPLGGRGSQGGKRTLSMVMNGNRKKVSQPSGRPESSGKSPYIKRSEAPVARKSVRSATLIKDARGKRWWAMGLRECEVMVLDDRGQGGRSTTGVEVTRM